MASTAVSPNNRAVSFRGKSTRERPRASSLVGSPQQSAGPADALRASDGDMPDFTSNAGTGAQMPMQSQAQRGAMYAAAAGKSTLGIPPSVGADFVDSDKPGKLPARKSKVKRMRKSGAISDKAASRRLSQYSDQDDPHNLDASSR